MNKIDKFLERIKVKPKKMLETVSETEKNKNRIDKIDNIGIEIETEIKLFDNEEETIIDGARELLEQGRTANIEEAIITFAVEARGLKHKETRKTEDGKLIIVFEETLQNEIDIIDRD